MSFFVFVDPSCFGIQVWYGTVNDFRNSNNRNFYDILDETRCICLTGRRRFAEEYQYYTRDITIWTIGRQFLAIELSQRLNSMKLFVLPELFALFKFKREEKKRTIIKLIPKFPLELIDYIFTYI